jgi:UDP-N-acetylmuramoyl-L-alanyl-D-glutamate--2,6-diaminopimelate ligase
MSGAQAPNPIALGDIVVRLTAAGLLKEAPMAEAFVRGVSDDSRSVKGGDLFCAWSGTSADAHEFVPSAEQQGAVAAIVERRVPDVKMPQVVVRDGRRAAAIAALCVFGNPQDALTLVGVTGTNGKTTTVGLLRHLLSERGPAASIGTLGAIGADNVVIPGTESLTTPGPVELARVLRGFVDAGVQSVAMETSSHALDQGRVAGLRFDVAVFTNLTRDHIDYHGSEEAYFAAKARLLDLLRTGGVAVLNADDAAWRRLGGRAPRTVWFRVDGASVVAADEVRALDVTYSAEGARFVLAAGTERAAVRLPLLGAYNVQNALGAAAACIALGMDVKSVAANLMNAPQVPGRLERIADTPCPVLADYAHTPDALERVLATLRPLTRGRLIVVFGAGGDRDRGKRPQMGAIAARYADVAIVTSDNPRTEDPDAIIDEILTGMDAEQTVRVTDRREAIGRALEIAGSGDVVLLAGKGHETYQVLGTTKVDFDERIVVREWLESHTNEVRA